MAQAETAIPPSSLIGTEPAGAQPEYAGMNLRITAATIDALLLYSCTIPLLNMVMESMYGDSNIINLLMSQGQPATGEDVAAKAVESGVLYIYLLSNLFQLIVAAIYCVFFWKRFGATPGKWLFRLRVVHAETGNYLTAAQSLRRYFAYMVSAIPLCLGIFWIGIDKKHQGWHDKIAKTYVIVLPKKKKPAG